LLCCGRSNTDFDTKPRENWRGELSTLQFIVPSPMRSVTGLTKGDLSSIESRACACARAREDGDCT
jgi:hypothetical protein